MRQPIILVGDTKLGGITSTLTALESLVLRGYTVHAICLVLQYGSTSLVNTEAIIKVFSLLLILCDDLGFNLCDL